MESQQESRVTGGSPRRFGIGSGNFIINQCYERCGSGNTTTNTSLSEIPSSVDSELEHTLCHEESRLNGHGGVLSNNDGLPYASAQLTPQTVHNHHYQRTLNNDTAATAAYFRRNGL